MRHTLKCKTCGEKYTEKTAKGHTRMFGHKEFVNLPQKKRA